MNYYNTWLEKYEIADSMIDRLSGNRLFKVTPYNKTSVTITELCDEYFFDTLNKQDLLVLIDELTEVANSLEDL